MPEEDTLDPREDQDPTDTDAPEAADQAAPAPEVADQGPDEQTLDDQAQDDQAQEEDTLAPFEFTAEDTDTLKKAVTVTVPEERIDAKRDELYGELSQSAQVPGFRIGRAPRRLVEKRFGKEVSRDVCNALVGEALGYVAEHAEFNTLGEPDLKLEEIELPDEGDLTFSFEIEVAPEFELPEMKGIPVERVVLDITDERVNEYVSRMREQQPKFEESSQGAAAERDIVIVDTTVSVEGIEAPVESVGTPLRVSVGQIEGLPLLELGRQLEGKTVGDTVTLTVTVPQAHPNEEWRGRGATVEITLTRLRRRILPEIGDEYAAGLGFDSMDDYRTFVRERMTEHVVAETQQAMRDQVGRYLLDNTDFELPPAIATRHASRTLQRRYVDLMRQGVPRDRIEEHMTELQAASETEAARDLKLMFIVGKIARNEDIQASEEEINSRVADIAARSNRRPERVRHQLEQDGNLGQIESQIIEEKVFDKLLEQARVEELSGEEVQARRDAAQGQGADDADQGEAPDQRDQAADETKDDQTDQD